MQISLMLLQRIWSQFKIRWFLKEIAPAGTKKLMILSHFMQNFSLHIAGQCLKIVTGFAQIFVCEIKIYLFGSHLRFKSQYKFWV